MGQAYNPSARDTEAGPSWIQNQLGINSKILSLTVNQQTKEGKYGHLRPKVALILWSIEITHDAYRNVCSMLTSSEFTSEHLVISDQISLTVLVLAATLGAARMPMLRTSVWKLESCSYQVLTGRFGFVSARHFRKKRHCTWLKGCCILNERDVPKNSRALYTISVFRLFSIVPVHSHLLLLNIDREYELFSFSLLLLLVTSPFWSIFHCLWRQLSQEFSMSARWEKFRKLWASERQLRGPRREGQCFHTPTGHSGTYQRRALIGSRPPD